MYDYLCFYDFEAAFNVVNTSEKIHMPIIYSYIIINTKIREIVDTYSEINIDPEILINSFLERILNFWLVTCPDRQQTYPIDFSETQKQIFDNQNFCEICLRYFTPDIIKCAHHEHNTRYSNYVSALCIRCNFKILRQKNLILISHNSTYDMAFLLKYSNEKYSWQMLTQKSNMKFYFLYMDRFLKFIDSFQFLKSSLAKLIIQTQKDQKDFYFLIDLFLINLI